LEADPGNFQRQFAGLERFLALAYILANRKRTILAARPDRKLRQIHDPEGSKASPVRRGEKNGCRQPVRNAGRKHLGGFDELLEAHPSFFALFVAIIAAINIDRKKTMRVEAVRELVRRFPLLEDWEMNSLLGQVFAANPPLARLAAETLVRSRVGSGG